MYIKLDSHRNIYFYINDYIKDKTTQQTDTIKGNTNNP